MTSRTLSLKWWALGAVCLNILAVSLDGTVLSVALPTLGSALHASESDLEWFQSGYLLLLAAGVIPAGLAGDRFGRKRLLLGSLAVFGAGSVLCAEASSPGVFLAARLMMGLAGSGVTVMALSALTVLFDDQERPKAVGIYEAANFLALPLGPILGGWMLSRFWWGWVFLLNVPVVALGLIIGLVLVPGSRAEQRPELDPLGAATSVVGLVTLTYGLIEAGQDGWGDAAAVTLMIAGLLVLGGFALWERRLSARGGQPMIDPGLIRSASFTVPAALSGVAGLGFIGLLFTMPQYFQAVRGVSSLGSGLRLLPLVAGLIIGALPAGALAKWLGPKIVVTLGFILLGLGAALGMTTRPGSSTTFVAAWMVVLCAGTGLTLTAATAAALSRLSPDRSGIGSAVVQAFQKTAGPLGTAIVGSVLTATYQSRLDLGGLPGATAALVRQSVYQGVAIARQTGSVTLAHSVRGAFVDGIDKSLLFSVGTAIAGAAIALVFLPTTRRSPAAPARRPAGQLLSASVLPPLSASVLRLSLRTSNPASCAIPMDGPPTSSHDRAIPTRKQTTTRTAIVCAAPPLGGLAFTCSPAMNWNTKTMASPAMNTRSGKSRHRSLRTRISDSSDATTNSSPTTATATAAPLVSPVSENNDTASALVNAVSAAEARSRWICVSPVSASRSLDTEMATNSRPMSAPATPALATKKS
jgi:EmrB/QacA subfamily drug resistance transporter